jgi:hypothetical protein
MYSLGGKFPWLHKHTCPTFPPDGPWQKHKAWVWLPDGRKGVIDHLKIDGNLGVRPLADDGKYLPNISTHWTDAQRMKIPEEVAVAPGALKPVLEKDIPPAFIKGIHE